MFPVTLMELDWDKVRDRELYRPRGNLEADLEETKAIMAEVRDRGMLNAYIQTRDKLFPMDTTGSTSNYNRAGDKLSEILRAVPALIDGKETFLDVAGGPGAFSKVLIDKGMQGYGITLATENESLAWYPDLTADPRFSILWGERVKIQVKDKDGRKIDNYAHGNGNIYKVANFDAVTTTLHDATDGVDLVVSDGGIGVDINQETESTRLILSEMMFAIANLKDDGGFVCKLFETHTKLTHDLILIMASMFEKSYIIKPRRSRRSNSERYLVCTGYIRDADLADFMLDVYKMAETENGPRIKLTRLPAELLTDQDDEEETEGRVPSVDFNKRLVEISDILDRQQADTMMEVFEEMMLPPVDQPQGVYTYEGEKHGPKAIFVPIDRQTGQLTGELAKSVLPATVEQLAKENILVYPYKRYTMGNIYEIFAKLKTHTPTIKLWSKYETRGALIFKDGLPDFGLDEYKRIPVIEATDDEYHINKLTDYFTEYARVMAKVKDQELTPVEFWRKNADWIVYSLREENKPVTSHEMREFLFRHTKEATQFKITTSKFVYDLIYTKMGRPIRVLDPCGGWGDRRLGAMASDHVQAHFAYDPNSDLVPGYAEMDDYFQPADRTRKFVFVPKPASEISKRLVGDIDLVFTSPPYFDYEDYSKNPGQSIEQYPTLEAWLHGFLFDMLDKSWNCLVSGGYLIIHLTDVKRIPMCEPMYKHMGAKKDAKFAGAILTKAKVIVPLWIWRKL